MQIRHIGGIIESRYPAGSAFEVGTVVVINSDQQIVPCGNDALGNGISVQAARNIGAKQNLQIFNASYDEGLTGDFYGRRNDLKQTYCNIGDAVGVLMGAGNVIEGIKQYVGTPTHNQLLTSNASGWLKGTSNRDIAIARCTLAAEEAYPDGVINIVTL